MIQFDYFKHELIFSFEAITSRGAIQSHSAFIISAVDSQHPHVTGYGEASPLIGLSIDALPDFENQLQHILKQLNQGLPFELIDLTKLPSVRFGLETAILDLKNGGQKLLFKSDFVKGKPIPINGLVWMKEPQSMLDEAIEKARLGYDCIKFKIGAHDFDTECRMLEKFRKKFSETKVQIRLDANGAFAAGDALLKLKELNRFKVHSIEQPIAPKQPESMAKICQDSPIPIALDEELIGLAPQNDASFIFKTLKPQYLILKPTLIGGLGVADLWISQCETYQIGWWATSALESNIALNAIAQWVSAKSTNLYQGLGTGNLYTNNFQSPLVAEKGHLFYIANARWNMNHAKR